MIESICECGAQVVAPESGVGHFVACEACGKQLHVICSEALPEGAGGGDFDAKLVITAGPQRVGEQLLLGGVQEINIGKLPDRQIVLPGATRVSRAHAKLARVDFGPSRWELHDNNSTNGVLINGHRILNQELKNGDRIQIGEYEFRFVSALDRVVAAAREKERKNHKGPICPSCDALLPVGAKICTNCGVDVKTGRSLVISKGLDENDLAARADTWIKVASFVMPFGLFPIASEAFGMRKPITTWVIAAITIVCSIGFYIAVQSSDGNPGPAVENLMQWSGKPITADQMASVAAELEAKVRAARDRARFRGTDDLTDARIHELVLEKLKERSESQRDIGFHWYQLFTCALIHDPNGLLALIYHLGGNMVFFFVFGTRVNELVGNLKFAILYPLLCAGSGLIDQYVHMNDPLQAGLGASGAIMGLAGMYFVFFPIQKVHTAIWLRLWWFGFRTWLGYKVFQMRGFWLLVLWIGFNDVLPVAFGWKDHVGHWAHLGGFITGFMLALILLLSRQASAMGNDLISVALGKRAWALVGRPVSQLATASA